jgi:hypothetical protein
MGFRFQEPLYSSTKRLSNAHAIQNSGTFCPETAVLEAVAELAREDRRKNDLTRMAGGRKVQPGKD